MNKTLIDLQIASAHTGIPSQQEFERWAELVCSHIEEAEITIRIVDEEESRALNREYRSKDKPTNVLSFPFEAPEHAPLPLLGDLVICAPLVKSEAQAQQKNETDHWAHLTIHGTLHLLGYDHIDAQEAIEMETLETKILAGLGIADPYSE